MATDTQLEAQRLVSISLSKMAQSRIQKTGASLHKSLLVATVLQKARFLCMEEVFKIVHPSVNFQQQQERQHEECYTYEDDDPLIGLTPEEAGIHSGNDFNDTCSSSSSYESESLQFDEYSTQTSISHDSSEYCARTPVYDKENLAPCSLPAENPTYFDLDQTAHDQAEEYSACNNKTLKRRRTICESEADDAVQLATTKKTKVSTDDSLFFDNVENDVTQKQGYRGHNCTEEQLDSESKAMDIDRITSLVSIFSFGGMSNSSSMTDISPSSSTNHNSTNCCVGSNNFGNLTRSSSTPDLCSAQAKEAESIQQRPYIAMTV